MTWEALDERLRAMETRMNQVETTLRRLAPILERVGVPSATRGPTEPGLSNDVLSATAGKRLDRFIARCQDDD